MSDSPRVPSTPGSGDPVAPPRSVSRRLKPRTVTIIAILLSGALIPLLAEALVAVHPGAPKFEWGKSGVASWIFRFWSFVPFLIIASIAEKTIPAEETPAWDARLRSKVLVCATWAPVAVLDLLVCTAYMVDEFDGVYKRGESTSPIALLVLPFFLFIIIGVCYALASGGVALFVRSRRKRAMGLEPLCAHCGYSLRGIASSRCPECGQSLPSTQERSK